MDIKKILFKTCELDAVNMLPDAVLVCKKDGEVVWMNDKADNLFYPASDKQMLTELVENGYNMLINAVLLNKPLSVKKMNSDTNLDMMVRETEDVYIVSFRESAIQTNEEQNEDYKVINRDKNSFLIKLANDFKSPLQSIIGFSQAISDGLGGNITLQQDKYIKIIKKNSTDLMYFVEKLILLSKTENEFKQVSAKTFDILNCAKMLAKYNMHLFKEKSINITVGADEGVKNTFVSDEEVIKQSLQNVIEVLLNSIEMGEIMVRICLPSEELCKAVNMKPDSLLITVSSTSLLLTENEIDNLFDPYKIIDTSNRKSLLKAIILTSVKNMLQLIGGQIWAETKPLKESGICILLPQHEV